MGSWATFFYRPAYAAQGVTEFTLFDTGLLSADTELALVQSHRQLTSNAHGLVFTGNGAGGGLDADKLDGFHASNFTTAAELSAHGSQHASGGTDAITLVAAAASASFAVVATSASDSDTLDGQHATSFASSAHAASHEYGGSDVIPLDLLGAPSDILSGNATSAVHGLLPKFPGNTTTFFRGDGTYAAPTSSNLIRKAIIVAPSFETRAIPTSAWMAFTQTEGTNFDFGQLDAPSGNDTKAFSPSIKLGNWNSTAMTGTIGWKTSTTSASPAGVVFVISAVGVSAGQTFDSVLTELSSAAVSAGATAAALNISTFTFNPSSIMLADYDSIWQLTRKARTASGAVGDTLLNTASVLFFTLEWQEQ